MAKIFVSVSGDSYEECLQCLEGAEYAELRLDLTTLSRFYISLLMPKRENWIVTVRKEFLTSDDYFFRFLCSLYYKTLYVDIDYSLISLPQTQQLLSLVYDTEIDILFSYHNYERTPSSDVLKSIAEDMFRNGADAVKITCMANDEKDGEILTGLYHKFPKIIAFGMGEHGVKSRIESMFLGDGIAYAAPDNGKSTAPGQLTLSQMKELYRKRTQG